MCDTMVAVLGDRVLFAKNSDRDPNEAQSIEWHAPRRAGGRLRCTWIEIDDAPRTFAVTLSRPFWMWGAEIGANEHGVAIGNEAVFTRGGYDKSGLTGMDLVRLGLERGASARQAVEVMTGLLERHGQGGRCGHEHAGFSYHNSFLVADSHGALVLETVGRRWAVEEVRGARAISNGLTIPALARRDADPIAGRVAECVRRRALTEAAAGRAVGVADLIATLRSHGGPAWPRYAALNGTLAMPCMHGGGLVASSQTTSSWVAELRPGGARHFVTATAAPCLSLFKPIAVERPLELGPPATDRVDGASLFWAQERLHRAVMRAPEVLARLFLAERDAAEAAELEAPPDGAGFAAHRRLIADWSARVERVAPTLRDRRPPWARRYWRRREAWAAAGRAPIATLWADQSNTTS